jgi:hypothetical protein
VTLFAGEFFRIKAEGADFDGTEFTDDNVQAVTVKIYDRAKELIVDSPMTWDEDESIWVYLWDTSDQNATPSPLAPGSYRYQVIFTGMDGKMSWEWKRVRLSKNPITPA